MIAVIGDTHIDQDDEKWQLAVSLGRRLIDEGYRIVTGGLGDLPQAVALGARRSTEYREGDLIAILPGFDPSDAGDCADIIIPTGIDYARNMIIANCDAVVAIGGGAGTLSEMALAWSLKRLIVAYKVPGWSGRLAGKRIDRRRRHQGIKRDQVLGVRSDGAVAEVLNKLLPHYGKRHRGAVVRVSRVGV